MPEDRGRKVAVCFLPETRIAHHSLRIVASGPVLTGEGQEPALNPFPLNPFVDKGEARGLS